MYYNQKYRFSIDYPVYNQETNITTNQNRSITNFHTATINYTISVNPNNGNNISDPRELAISKLHDLPLGQVPLYHGAPLTTSNAVTLVIVDGVQGYGYSVIDFALLKKTGLIPSYEYLFFNYNGMMYNFTLTVTNKDQFDVKEYVVKSIKFFD